jgi:DNA repair photolyase
VRDVEVRRELAQGLGGSVDGTSTTRDEALWRVLAPGPPPPRTRLQGVRRWRDAGIPGGGVLAPLRPGSTATRAAIASEGGDRGGGRGREGPRRQPLWQRRGAARPAGQGA